MVSCEMLIELGDSWLIAKTMAVVRLSIPLPGIAPNQLDLKIGRAVGGEAPQTLR